ncbi:SURF1-domain-containing protein [Phellopilus nigrolimitatus]|nr:SURF1-domain-containing protein [Phellopilus nigrolimitatus]
MNSFFLSRTARAGFLRQHAAQFSWRTQRVLFHRSCIRRNVQQEQSEQSYRAKHSSTLTPTMVLLGFMPVFTFVLGTWQIQRLKWKIDLIDELQEKLQRSPMKLPDFVNVDALSEFTFRKVLVSGRWDHAHTILIGPRVRDGTKGVNVITPLIRTDGSTILVDRGFVPDDFKDAQRWRDLTQSSETVEILGMLRMSQTRNNFTPDNQPAKGEWYWVDVDALAENAGGKNAGVQPVYVEAIFEGHSGDAHLRMSKGIPVGRAPTVEVRNQHTSYVFTWYSLSALTAFMFIHLLRRRARAPVARMPR